MDSKTCMEKIGIIDEHENKFCIENRKQLDAELERCRVNRKIILKKYGIRNAQFKTDDIIQNRTSNRYIVIEEIDGTLRIDHDKWEIGGNPVYRPIVVYRGKALRMYKGKLIPYKSYPKGLIDEQDAVLYKSS